MPLAAPVGFLYWYSTSIILALLILINVFSHVHHYFSRPSQSTTALQTVLPAPVTSTVATKRINLGATETSKLRSKTVIRLARCAQVAFEKYVVLTAVPLLPIWLRNWRPVMSSVPTTELVWSISYSVGVLVLSFWGGEAVYPLGWPNAKRHIE